jgi:hypothetical protein
MMNAVIPEIGLPGPEIHHVVFIRNGQEKCNKNRNQISNPVSREDGQQNAK